MTKRELANSEGTLPEEERPSGVVLKSASLPRLPPLAVQKALVLITVLGPLLGCIIIAYKFWNRGIGISEISLCFGMYIPTMIGITVGFHRLFTHRSFQCATWVKVILGVFGSMAAQGPLLFWVADHRQHHRESDQAGDPHSPNNCGKGVRAICLGFWHAHLGWMITHKADENLNLGRDILHDRVCVFINTCYPLWVASGFILPATVGWVIERNWNGIRAGLLFGGIVRIALAHQATWAVNSVCHLFGGRSFHTADNSRNNAGVALITLGEGWHNNHHAFPTSARHGLAPLQLDVSWWVICIMGRIGLAWDVRVPTRSAMDVRHVE